MKPFAKQTARGQFKSQIVKKGEDGKDLVQFMSPAGFKTRKAAIAHAAQFTSATQRVADLLEEKDALQRDLDAARAANTQLRGSLEAASQEASSASAQVTRATTRIAELEGELERTGDVISARDSAEKAAGLLVKENEALTKRATKAEDSVSGYKWALGATLAMALTIIVIVVDTTIGWGAIIH